MNDPTPEITPDDAPDAFADAAANGDPLAEAIETLAGEPSNSLVERLREQREALSIDRTEVFALPGYEELGVEYRVVDDTRLKRLLGAENPSQRRKAKQRGASKDEFTAATDLIIQSAVQVMVWTGDDWTPAHETPAVREIVGDEPISFGPELVRLLLPKDPEPKSARQALRQVIPLTMGVLDHAHEIMEWQQGKNREIDKEIAGE